MFAEDVRDPHPERIGAGRHQRRHIDLDTSLMKYGLKDSLQYWAILVGFSSASTGQHTAETVRAKPRELSIAFLFMIRNSFRKWAGESHRNGLPLLSVSSEYTA